MTCLDPTRIMESAAACTGHTPQEAAALLVIGGQAAIALLVAFVVVMAAYLAVRR